MRDDTTAAHDRPAPTGTVRARLLLIVLCVAWGITWPTMRIALTEIPPFSMRVESLFLGVITLIVLARLQGRRIVIESWRTLVHFCVASLFNIIIFSILTPFAQLSAATSRVAIVVYTMPIWASLMALPVLGERLNATRIVALALCTGGLAILIYPLARTGTPTGLILALGAAMGWAAGTIYMKWAKLDGDPVVITLWQLIVGFVALGACVPVFEGTLHLDAHIGPLLALAFSGVVGTGICYFLWFDVVQRLPTSTASLGVLSAPVVGVIASIILLGERPTLTDIIGFALMLAASAVVLLWPHETSHQGSAQGPT